MDSTIFAFVDDIGELLDPQKVYNDSDGSVTRQLGITVAAAYHQARDVTPHGPARLTWRRDGVHFAPGSHYGRLCPPVQEGAGDHLLRVLRTATRERGKAMNGWAVFCHNTTLGLAHPDITQETCFGDRAAPADLCPANPDVREYAVALARDVARLGVDSVVAESLHYGFLEHGYHHERSFAGLGQVEEFAFGLCFCEHCMLLDGAEEAREECRAALDRVFDGAPAAQGPLRIDSLGSHTAVFLRARMAAVGSLVAEVAAAVTEEGSRLVFLDLTGALKGYGDGLPTGVPSAEDAWRIGVDPAAVAAAAGGYGLLAYARDPERVAIDVAAYRSVCGPDVTLRAVLRPGLPDTRSAAELAAKVDAASRAGADGIDFYAYGLLPLDALARIGSTQAHSDVGPFGEVI